MATVIAVRHAEKDGGRCQVIDHFCVGVENFSIDAALETLKSDFPESKPIIYRGEELYFRDPDGILGQISGVDYRGQRTTP